MTQDFFRARYTQQTFCGIGGGVHIDRCQLFARNATRLVCKNGAADLLPAVIRPGLWQLKNALQQNHVEHGKTELLSDQSKWHDEAEKRRIERVPQISIGNR